jgi:hypothetical protein
MSTNFALLLVAANIACLLIGFMLGDEHHHEVADIADDSSWDRHVQQALYVSRRTP